MKKFVLAISMMTSFAGIAQANSSVTVYSVIDLGFDYTFNANKDGQNRLAIDSGRAQGSRFGFKGNEDLGNGLNAIFQLENGFDAANGKAGQGGRLFGRQLWMGLSSTSAGTVTLGRQYDSVVDYLGSLTANGNWAGWMFSHPLDNDNTDNSLRTNNSIKYTSPNFSGFTFGGMYGFGEVAGDSSQDRVYSLGARYRDESLSLGVGYLDLNRPGTTENGAISVGGHNFLADRQKTFGAGINYKIASSTLGFVYTSTKLKNPTASSYFDGTTTNLLPDSVIGGNNTLNGLRFNNYELNLKQQITPEFFIGAMYVYTQGKYDAAVGESKLKWNTFGLMADYNLSKRTDVYSQFLHQRVGGHTGSVGNFLGRAHILGSGGISGNQKQSLIRLGLRHKF